MKKETVNNRSEIANIKANIVNTVSPNNESIERLEAEINDMKKHLNGIEQYLLNNLALICKDLVIMVCLIITRFEAITDHYLLSNFHFHFSPCE